MKHILSAATLDYLSGWLAKSERYQSSKGVHFNLDIDDFLSLWGNTRLARLDTWILTGMQGNRMHRTNAYAFVLTWSNREAMERGMMNRSTAQVTTRAASRAKLGIIKGEKHSDGTKRRISEKLTGRTQPASQVEKRAAKMRGVKRAPRSEETKKKIAEGMRAARASKRVRTDK